MKDDVIQRTNQANTRRKRSPCAPNRGRTYDLPIRTSEALPLIANRSDEGLTLETSAFYPLRWLIYVFNPVVNTKLPAILSHRRSTTVSLETYPFALPLSCKRLVIGERGLYFELNCDVTLAKSVMKFYLSSHNFAISNVDCDMFRMHIASLLLLLLSLVQKRSLLKSMRHD